MPWQDLTGLKRPEQIFRLFDLNKDGVITWEELFPVQANGEDTLQRPSTPDFLDIWFRKNKSTEFPEKARSSKWSPEDPSEVLQTIYDSQSSYKEAAVKKKWMRDSFRRLKNKGKTDARARECICAHLPLAHGTGPRDRDGCATISDTDKRNFKKSYQDAFIEPVKNIQKEVYEMKEQRRTLQNFRINLEKVAKMEAAREAQRKEAATALFPGLGLAKSQVDDEDHGS